jgi:hypothetical protein
MPSARPKAKQVPMQMRYNFLLPPRTLIRDPRAVGQPATP